MDLAYLWFWIVGFLFVGYFVLDGFDFGVGMSLPFLGKNDISRRQIINTIGPVWDLNETWVIVAGACLFAAFPEWYATLFSGFYLALLLILLTLILRGVSFEYRHQRDSLKWKRGFDMMIVVGSAVPALLWGVAFANIVQGVPLDVDHEFTGSLLTLLNPFGLLGGVVTLLLFLTHGAMFLALKTDGDIRLRARALSVKLGLGAAVAAVVFLVWTQSITGDPGSAVLFVLAALALVGGIAAAYAGREGWGFLGTFVCIGLAVAGLFAALFPDVMPSSTDAAYSLTTTNAAATAYTLKVMTWVAAIFTPLVLLYQSWTYWVFRKRISVHHIADHEPEPVS